MNLYHMKVCLSFLITYNSKPNSTGPKATILFKLIWKLVNKEEADTSGPGNKFLPFTTMYKSHGILFKFSIFFFYFSYL